jgi:hypothetical protein
MLSLDGRTPMNTTVWATARSARSSFDPTITHQASESDALHIPGSLGLQPPRRLLAVQETEDDGGAVGGQPLHYRSADATRPAVDQRGLTLENPQAGALANSSVVSAWISRFILRPVCAIRPVMRSGGKTLGRDGQGSGRTGVR